MGYPARILLDQLLELLQWRFVLKCLIQWTLNSRDLPELRLYGYCCLIGQQKHNNYAFDNCQRLQRTHSLGFRLIHGSASHCVLVLLSRPVRSFAEPSGIMLNSTRTALVAERLLSGEQRCCRTSIECTLANGLQFKWLVSRSVEGPKARGAQRNAAHTESKSPLRVQPRLGFWVSSPRNGH